MGDAEREGRTLVAADPGLHGSGSAYLDRELSQLEFNLRVLELARRPELPVLERVKYLAISASNTDELHQKRVGGIREQVRQGVDTASRSGLGPAEQLAAIRVLSERMTEAQSRILEDELVPALEEAGLPIRSWSALGASEREQMTEWFRSQAFPILTPLAIDSGRPFPHISSLSLNLMVVLDEGDGLRRHARVKLPGSLPRYLVREAEGFVITLEELVIAHLPDLFPGMRVLEVHPFRVTRNADVALETGEIDDLLETIEERLLRRRFGEAVRLEIAAAAPGPSADVRERLLEALEIDAADVQEVPEPLDPAGLIDLYETGPARLKEAPREPVTPPALVGVEGPEDLFRRIREEDILVHHPYESFDASVAALVEAAAMDPRVAAIKLTIYRTSESESTMVDALVRAARAGKQAVALVELKARFDEESNIARARRLEEAGVHVVYGFVGLKTHTKILLVVRDEEDGARRYTHVGTGNYNPKTARLYEDLGLLTADPDVGEDVSELFNILTGFSKQADFRRLVVAPRMMRKRLLELVREEGKAGGRIVIKVNNLVDAELIDALYVASEAGAEIDLVVRSQCCLRPGIEGRSSRVRVRSIVGRYLEHSRVYRFGEGPEGTYLIGSADVMGRNLDRRYEALVSIVDPRLRVRLDALLDSYLADDRLAWNLEGDGTWRRAPEGRGIAVHDALEAGYARR